MSLYRKAFAALAGAVVVTLASATSDNAVSAAEMVQVIMAALGAFGVYLVPNMAGYRIAKAVTSALAAGFGLVGGWLASGEAITTSMWLNVALAVGAALGVFVLPNEDANRTPVAPTSKPL